MTGSTLERFKTESGQMTITPILNDQDHEAAIARIEELWGAPEGTEERAELSALFILVHAYEEERWPIEPVDPVEVITEVMEQKGYRQSDLSDILNSRSKASMVLNRRRPLTLDDIRKISGEWGIPADLLVQEYALAG